MNNETIETPTDHDLHTDANVTIASLPADEQAWVAKHFGWDMQDSPEQIEEQYQHHLDRVAEDAAQEAMRTLTVKPIASKVRTVNFAAFIGRAVS